MTKKQKGYRCCCCCWSLVVWNSDYATGGLMGEFSALEVHRKCSVYGRLKIRLQALMVQRHGARDVP